MRNRARIILLLAAIFSLVLAIGVPLSFSAIYGISQMGALSRYRDLDLNGVIDQDKLRRLHNPRVDPDNWLSIPRYITAGQEDWKVLGWLVAALWGVNGLALHYVRSTLRPTFTEKRAMVRARRLKVTNASDSQRGFEVVQSERRR